MNRNQERRANEVLDLYIACHEKRLMQDEIAKSGPTQESKMLEYHGDFPQLSNIKPDILSVKVEKMRRYYISAEEALAYRVIMAIPHDLRLFITLHRHFKNQHNPVTKKPFTHSDCAEIAGKSIAKYNRAREVLMPYIAERFDKRMKMETVKIREVV